MKIVVKSKQIKDGAKKSAIKQLNRTVGRGLPGFIQSVKDKTFDILTKSHGYTNILNSSFSSDFGFYPGEEKARLDAIVREIVDGMEIKFTPYKYVGDYINGGLSIGVLLSDYRDILALPAAGVYDVDNGYILPWLDWTLNYGNQIIVSEHSIVFDNFSGTDRSRSGKALMKAGGTWRVPNGITGTANNNWLTRAFLDGNLYVNMLNIESNKFFGGR